MEQYSARKGNITNRTESPILWLILMNVLWAVGYPITAIALSTGLSPSFLAVVRLGMAFLLLSPLLIRVKHWSWRLLGRSSFLGLVGFSLPMWLQIVGLHRTDAAIAAISISLEPLFTILLAALLNRVHVPGGQKIALLLAVIGSWILTGEPRPGHLGHLAGDVALIFAIVCFAVYNVYSPGLAKSVDAGPAAALSFGLGTLGSMVIWLLTGAPLPTHTSFTMVWSLAYLALGTTGLAYFLWLYVVSRHSITTSALFLYVQPLLGTLVSFTLGQSPVTASLIGGGLLILVAMTLGQEVRPAWLGFLERR